MIFDQSFKKIDAILHLAALIGIPYHIMLQRVI